MAGVITTKTGYSRGKAPTVRVRKSMSLKLARRHYRSLTDLPTPFSALPFVYRPVKKTSGTHWSVPENIDYQDACTLGRDYAAHFIRYLTDNPDMVGMSMFGSIVKDIDFQDESDRKGCWVGFFAYVERIIHAQGQRMDVFADVERLNSDEVSLIEKVNSPAEAGRG